MTIQYYNWVSNNGKLNANGWSVPLIKGQLPNKINLWSNNTLVPCQPFSEICFHDNQM